MSSPSKEKNKKIKKKFGDDFSQEEQHEEALDGDYVDPEQQKKEEEERERKEAVMNHNGDVRMELKARPTEWLQGQKKRVRVEFEEDSPSSSDDDDEEEEKEKEKGRHQEKDTEETEVDEDIIPTQRPSPAGTNDTNDDDAHLKARENNAGILERTINAAAGIIETVVNIVSSPFKSPNKRARISDNDMPQTSPGIFGSGGSPFAKGIAMTPKSLAKVIDATGAAAGENNANVAKMEWGAKGGETWQQKKEDEGEAKKKRAARKKLVLGDDDDSDDESVDDDEEKEENEQKKVTTEVAAKEKPTTTSTISEIASQVTEVASEANWEVLTKLMAEREKEKKASRELGLNVDRTRRISGFKVRRM